MIEAFKVGVALSLSGNVAGAVGELIKQFETLNKAVQAVQMSVNEVAAGMRGLGRVGDSAAKSWRDAANSMERAARAARGAGSAMGGGPGEGAGSQRPRRPGRNPLLLTYDPLPYARGEGFLLSGPPRGPGRDLVPAGDVFDHDPTHVRSPSRGGMTLYRGAGGLGPVGGTDFSMARDSLDLPGLERGGLPRREAPSSHDLAVAAGGFGAVAAVGKSLLENSAHAAAEIELERKRMETAQFTPEQIKRAEQIAHDLQRKVASTTVAGGMHAVNELYTLTQNADEALNEGALEEFAKADVVYRAYNQQKEGGELWKAMQAAELRGLLTDPKTKQIGTDRVRQFLTASELATFMSFGRYGPGEQLNVLRSAATEGALMSQDTLLTDLMAPAIGLGMSRAGRGMEALGQQFTAGRMSGGAGFLLAEADILHLPRGAPDPHNEKNRKAVIKYLREHYGTGIGQMMFPPEVMKEADLAARNPAEFVLKDLVPAADRWMKAHHIKAKDDDDLLLHRQQWIAASLSRIPGANVATDIIRQALLIERDKDSAARLRKEYADKGITPYDVLKDTPQNRLGSFNAATNAFMAKVGDGVMKDGIAVLNAFTSSLNAFTGWATANPKIADDLKRIAEDLTAFAIAAAAGAGALFVLRPMLTVLTSGPGSIAAFGIALAELAHSVDSAIPALRHLDDAVGQWMRGILSRAGEFLSNLGRTDTMRNAPASNDPGLPGVTPEMTNPHAQRSSFVRPAANSDHSLIHNVIYIDGERIASVVTERQARALSRAPASSSRFDPRITPIYPADRLRG